MANKQQVLKLVDDGKTFSDVASRLRLTRNQVAGIVFRARSPLVSEEAWWEEKRARDRLRRRRNNSTG